MAILAMSLLPSAILLDLDGTLYLDDAPIPGAVEAVAEIRRLGIPFRFTTNTTRRPRTELAALLAGMGIPAEPGEIVSAPSAAARWLLAKGLRRVKLLLPEVSWREFAALERVDERPDAVVVGDLGEGWTFPLLDDAFRDVMAGARLVAIQRNRFWRVGGRLQLDAGPLVAALEYATRREAVLIGKPSAEFFATAAGEMAVADLATVAVVGDDLDSDIRGARDAGMIAVALRTGKYRPEDEARYVESAAVVLDSIAELPAWLREIVPPTPRSTSGLT